MAEPTKSMRVRVNASRTAKGYSVDATAEMTGSFPDEMATQVLDDLEGIALTRLDHLMAKLNAKYPREVNEE